jgi:predicted dienelactone hydrolase
LTDQGSLQVLTRRLFSLAAAGAAIAALPGCAGARRREAQQPAPLAAPSDGSRDDTWFDTTRNRQIPVRIRVPNAPGPWPVILFSHGLGGNRTGGAVWGLAWANAGLLVIHMQHPGSDTDAIREQGVREAMQPGQVAVRLQDVRFVLDELGRRHKLPGSVFRQANVQAIGMAGHSFGAMTTLGMAGENFGAATPPLETRLKAFIALSPNLSKRPNAYANLRSPVMFITGTEDGDVVNNGATPQTRQQPFFEAPPGGKYLLVLDGADHMTFGGQNDLPRMMTRRRPEGAVAREAQHHALVQALTTTYWQAMLKNEEQAQRMLAQGAGVQAPDVFKSK